MVLKEERDGVVVLTFDRPARLNALDRASCVELAGYIRTAREPVVITGAGRAFCAGVDLGELEASKTDPVLMRELLDTVQSLTLAIYDCAAPVAVAMHGYAVGMGLELALCADLRAAHPDTKFAFPERLRGVEVTNAASWTFPQLAGAARAEELWQTARQFGADEALELGVVHAITTDCVGHAIDRLKRSAVPANPLRGLQRRDLVSLLRREANAIATLFGGQEST